MYICLHVCVSVCLGLCMLDYMSVCVCVYSFLQIFSKYGEVWKIVTFMKNGEYTCTRAYIHDYTPPPPPSPPPPPPPPPPPSIGQFHALLQFPNEIIASAAKKVSP